MFLKHLISGCFFFISIGSVSSDNTTPPGFVEGHLNILSPKPIDIGDENAATATAENYADYPLLILSRDGQKEIVRLTADENGNYRAALPSGDYVLDVQVRARKHVRARPQPFTVIWNQTVRVDMEIDTDHWRARSTRSLRPD